jgi:hypothetical protein
MDDLNNRDLSQVPDEELSLAERQELRRRLDAFVAAMRNRVFAGRTLAARPKSIAKWDPTKQAHKD